MKSLRLRHFQDFQIPLPPLPEQKRIVALLDQAFTAIAKAKSNTEQNLKNAREIFQSALQTEFANGKLKIDNGEWEEKKLGEVCEVFNGLWKGKKPPYIEVGVIRNTNFTKEGCLDDSNIAFLPVEIKQFEKRKLEYGDIILEKSGGGPKQPVGRVISFVKHNGNFSFSNFTSAIRILNKDILDFKFLHRWLFFVYVSGKTEPMQRQSTGIRNLQLQEYKQIQIPLPPLPEQKNIVKQLDALSTETKKLETIYQQKINDLDELKKSILQKAFRGEL